MGTAEKPCRWLHHQEDLKVSQGQEMGKQNSRQLCQVTPNLKRKKKVLVKSEIGELLIKLRNRALA